MFTNLFKGGKRLGHSCAWSHLLLLLTNATSGQTLRFISEFIFTRIWKWFISRAVRSRRSCIFVIRKELWEIVRSVWLVDSNVVDVISQYIYTSFQFREGRVTSGSRTGARNSAELVTLYEMKWTLNEKLHSSARKVRSSRLARTEGLFARSFKYNSNVVGIVYTRRFHRFHNHSSRIAYIVAISSLNLFPHEFVFRKTGELNLLTQSNLLKTVRSLQKLKYLLN